MEEQNQQVSPPDRAAALPAALPDVGELLTRSWQTYKERFSVLIPISLVALAVLPFSFLNDGSKFSIIFPWIFIWIPFALFFTFWEGAAMFFAVKDGGEKIGFGESFKRGLKKFWPLLGTTLLVMLTVVGGTLLLIIPGIMFGIWFTFAAYLVIAENLSGAAALSRSKQLVKGYFWGVFWRLLLIGAIAGAISAIISVIFDLTLGKDFGTVFSSLASVFTAPFQTVYMILVYEGLKKIKG